MPACPRHIRPQLFQPLAKGSIYCGLSALESAKSGASTGAFLMEPLDGRAVHPRKTFNFPVGLCELQLFQAVILHLTVLMSNQKPAAASDLHPFTMRAPFTEVRLQTIYSSKDVPHCPRIV
eukprot:363453-Chlamydomonas_euryale.AAC.5